MVVLVDSEPIHTLVLQGILADEGTDYTTEEVLQDGLGRSFPSQMGELILRLGLNKPIEHYATRFQEEILRCLGETAMPCPGAARLLDELGQRGYKLGLASSSAGGIVGGHLGDTGFPGPLRCCRVRQHGVGQQTRPRHFLPGCRKAGRPAWGMCCGRGFSQGSRGSKECGDVRGCGALRSSP